ncbi:MAG: indole-3-glycerol phosphate synthase TrpC [Bacillota bacterium]
MLNENGIKVDNKRNILNEIAEKTKRRIAVERIIFPLEEIAHQAENMPIGNFEFEKAISKKGMSFICEVKKASPSKGVIAEEFSYMQIAKDYESAGASAISCLTEPEYFMGKNKYLKEISQNVSLPILKKDFFVDEYMIYQAKIYGASAILLICSILTDSELAKYFEIANKLGLSAVFEAHDEIEIQRAINCGARVIGVNNRNLKTFEMNFSNSINLRKMVGEDVIFISESGIRCREDINMLENNNINAVLIGETLMRAPDKKLILNKLKGITA